MDALLLHARRTQARSSQGIPGLRGSLKFLIAGVLGILLSTTAQAAFMGVLVESRSTTSISGKMVWVCIYNVLGQRVKVVQERMCETTKQFE
jgi:hypothetical protein